MSNNTINSLPPIFVAVRLCVDGNDVMALLDSDDTPFMFVPMAEWEDIKRCLLE